MLVVIGVLASRQPANARLRDTVAEAEMLVTGLVGTDASRVVEHDPDAMGGHPLRVDASDPVEGSGLVGGQEQQAVHVRRRERADPSRGRALVDIAQQL